MVVDQLDAAAVLAPGHGNVVRLGAGGPARDPRRLLLHVVRNGRRHVRVAIAVGDEVVHVGQSDMPYAAARCLLGDDTVIGLSIDTTEQLLEAEQLDMDYLGIGPIFSTSTKADTSPEWGCEGLRKLRSQSRHLLVAIGGVNQSNAADVMRAGADGVAVVSAICSAPDPRKSAEELRRIIENARRSGADDA